LLWKRYIILKRDKRGLILELIVPIFMVVLGIILSKNPLQTDIVPLDITSNFYDEPTNVVANQLDAFTSSAVNPTFWTYFSANDFKFDGTNIMTLQAFDSYMQSKRKGSSFPKFAVFPLKLDLSAKKYAFHVQIDSRT